MTADVIIPSQRRSSARLRSKQRRRGARANCPRLSFRISPIARRKSGLPITGRAWSRVPGSIQHSADACLPTARLQRKRWASGSPRIIDTWSYLRTLRTSIT